MEPPENAGAYLKEGLRLVASGKLTEAIPQFETSARLRPGNSITQYNLGLACQQTGRFDDAIKAYEKAVAISPDFFEAWCNLSVAFQRTQRFDAAISAARKAVHLEPYDAQARRLLAGALMAEGHTESARTMLQQAQAMEQDPIATHLRRTGKLEHPDQWAEAWKHAQIALQMAPHHPHVNYTLGVLLLAQGRADEALPYLERATHQSSEGAAGWAKIGQAYLHRNALAQAREAFHQALFFDPDFPDAQYGQAWTNLIGGNLRTAWSDLERRWNPGGPRYPDCPVWQGEPLEGRSILLYAEQGFGDAIFLVRYVPLIAERGGRVMLECPKTLRRLFETVPKVSSVFAFGEPVPAVDFQVSVFSLPRIFETTPESIPARVPYLDAPEGCAIQLPEAAGAGLRVGLVWAGSALLLWARSRSLPLAALAPVLELEPVQFYSLQIGPALAQLDGLPQGHRIVNLAPQLTDFGATAAAIQGLDLVITVDTSIAHLAGALAKPVWVLLPFAPDWRWLLDRADSPWYPTMRLFRQQKPGQWSEAVAAVAEALKQRMACSESAGSKP